MSRHPCEACGQEKPSLTSNDYGRLRALYDAAERQARRQPGVTLDALLKPMLAEYQAITGEDEPSWVHIIVHELPADGRGLSDRAV